MLYYTLTQEQLHAIKELAQANGNATRGSRQSVKRQAQTFISLARTTAPLNKSYSELPTECVIYYTYTRNLGTRKWADCYIEYTSELIRPNVARVRYTGKSVMIDCVVFGGKVYRTVRIPKDRILFFTEVER